MTTVCVTVSDTLVADGVLRHIDLHLYIVQCVCDTLVADGVLRHIDLHLYIVQCVCDLHTQQ